MALAKRQGRLLTENIQGLRTAFCEVKAIHPFMMEAIVILPGHLHCIWTLPDGNNDLSTCWRQIKAAFSRQLSKAEHRSENQGQKGGRGIWQRQLWKHAIRNDTDYRHYKVATLEAYGS
jgi:putative transposase